MGTYYYKGQKVTRKEFTKLTAKTGSGYAALSSEGKRRFEAAPEETTYAAKKREVTVTVKPTLSNQEIIEQNKKILQDLEEKRQAAQQQGNRALADKLARQYNDIARVTNQKIKQENLNIEKAKTVSEFANLYPQEKAEEIVRRSGYEEYIRRREPADSKTKPNTIPATENLSPPIYQNRFLYDSDSNLWIDTQAGSGSVIGAANTNPKELYFYQDVDKKNIFGKIGGVLRSQDVKASQLKTTAGSSRFDILTLGSFNVLKGAGKGLKDIATEPQEVIYGFGKSIIRPAESFADLKTEFAQRPGETAGYIAAQSVVFDIGLKGAKKGSVYVEKSYFDARLQEGRVYDKGYVFDRLKSVEAIGREGEVLSSERQSLLYPQETLRVGPEIRSSYDYSIQTELPRPLEFKQTGAYRYKIIEPFEKIDIITPEGEASLIVERPKPAEELARARAFQEEAAKGSSSPGEQQPLFTPETPTKSKPDPFIVVEKGNKKLIFETGSNGPLFFSVTGGVAETLVTVSKDLFERFDEGRSKISPSEPEVSKAGDPGIIKTDSGSGSVFVPVVSGGNSISGTSSDVGLSGANNIKGIQTPSSTQGQPKINLFEPKDKIDLYEGFKIDQARKTDSDQGQNLDVVSIQDIGQDLQNDQIQEQIQITEPVVIQKITTNTVDPFKPIDAKPSPEPPFKPVVSNRVDLPDNTGFKTGFNVFVRRKGKFSRVSDKPLRFEEAKNFGASIVGSTAAATFKLEPTRASSLGTFTGKANLKDFYRKGSLFIEKRSRRIKSTGEKEEITLKGLAALRFGKRRKSLF